MPNHDPEVEEALTYMEQCNSGCHVTESYGIVLADEVKRLQGEIEVSTNTRVESLVDALSAQDERDAALGEVANLKARITKLEKETLDLHKAGCDSYEELKARIEELTEAAVIYRDFGNDALQQTRDDYAVPDWTDEQLTKANKLLAKETTQ